MKGKSRDAGPDHGPTLRLVSSSGPDGMLQPDDFDLVLDEDGVLEVLDEDDAIEVLDEEGAVELLLGNEFDGNLDFLLTPLLTEAERQMRSIRRPLDAEMWASELLGMLELGAPAESPQEERQAVTLNLATLLAEHAQSLNSLSGLAMLRTLSVIGPPQARELARQGAEQMLAAGLHDRAWASKLGRPDIRRSWRFADQEQRQESITVVFRYGKHEHTLTVLIDHELGGGVKDCWIGENPTGVLAEAKAALEVEGIEIEFIPPAQAGQSLRTALARPECPVAPEDIEDVAMSRALLQARVEFMESELLG